MDRRAFICGITGGLLAAPRAAEAQPAGKVYRVGVLTPFSIDHSRRDGPSQAFFEELRKLGWLEGQNFVFDWPDSQGSAEALPRLADELVERRPDVIIAGGLRAAQAAQAVTTTIPVVFAYTSDPVGNGLVESFARPGRNLTGLADGNLERYPKALQLLTEAIPEAKAVAYIGMVPRGSTPQSGSVLAKTLDRMQTAGRTLGARVFFIGGGRIEEIESAFFGGAPQRCPRGDRVS